jgi:transposase
MLGVLDPLGLPLATEVVSGEQADDTLYGPTIQRIHDSFTALGLLYVGDCKMSALGTRAHIAAAEDYYLCPWSNASMRADDVTLYVAWATAHVTTPCPISPPAADGSVSVIADG